ncbi:redox-regulated ATPase YchF [Balneolaceae bacterium ANBcel3]|nr:redox-regulated ATPase YchF [Balneolaceae bacterium ANBcel3]
MSLKCGIVGLPNVGKSSLFNALSNAGAESANFPFCTIDPNIGIVPVPDTRLETLSKLVKPAQVTPTSIEFVDIAGLVKGASEGKGKGNAFLSHIREVDLIIHVVRCFKDDDVIHVEGGIDPVRDIGIIESELLFKDLETLEKREERLKKMAKSGDKALQNQLYALQQLKTHIESGKPVRSWLKTHTLDPAFADLFFLTGKKVIYVCNVSEDDLPDASTNGYVRLVADLAEKEGTEALTVCAAIESEIAELAEEEKRDFLADIGLEESGLNRLISAAYKELGLITYFTAGPKEVRAWTIREGTKAPQAAGVIHTDFERGFIRAETISFEDYVETGSEAAARTAGKMRSEGRSYTVRDGDVILFRFNV